MLFKVKLADKKTPTNFRSIKNMLVTQYFLLGSERL